MEASNRPQPSAPANAPLPGVIGASAAMQQVYRMTRQVAPSSASVLLAGETGTGKELIAHAIHALSPRATGPFIRVNCGALSESLLESELFGHVKGSFTGAVANRAGRFEAAHTGTIFLDEISSTSEKLQVKLLRVLQEGEFERVGDTHTLTVDTRVIAATNRDLREEVQAGRFRDDLYYRLDVVQIDLPALRERRADIPALVEHFVADYCAENNRAVLPVTPEAMDLLVRYDWPGNVRELQNYVERCVVLCEGNEIRPEDLPHQVRGLPPPRSIRTRAVDMDSLVGELVHHAVTRSPADDAQLYHNVVGRIERELIEQVLADCSGVQIKAAARLGINRNTLHKKLKEYGIEEGPEPPG
jgi:DNA-binding NtrC family response regulator